MPASHTPSASRGSGSRSDKRQQHSAQPLLLPALPSLGSPSQPLAMVQELLLVLNYARAAYGFAMAAGMWVFCVTHPLCGGCVVGGQGCVVGAPVLLRSSRPDWVGLLSQY
jgi:hypothetical protein